MSHEIQVRKFNLSGKATIASVVLIAVGVMSFLGQLKADPTRAWSNFLTNYFFWLCIGLSGVFFAALQYCSGAKWSTPVRRIAESFIAYLPAALILFFVLLQGVHVLFEWSHESVVQGDAILKMKAGYLNEHGFIGRGLFLFAWVLLLGGYIVKNSIKQDSNGDAKLTLRNVQISAPFLLFFAWAFTFVAMDLMMSLAPHWFSTIFGIYCFSGLFSSGLSMIVLWALYLKKRGVLEGYFTEDHMHDLGKFMFAFACFWCYVGFSQFMLIWYANLPEETIYFIPRFAGQWKCVSIALYVIKFGFPFFFLISRKAKRSAGWMAFCCFWFFAAQWMDIYWMVYPTHFKEPVFGLAEVGVFAGFAGLFVLCVGKMLSKVSPLPLKDPWMEEALHHHQ